MAVQPAYLGGAYGEPAEPPVVAAERPDGGQPRRKRRDLPALFFVVQTNASRNQFRSCPHFSSTLLI